MKKKKTVPLPTVRLQPESYKILEQIRQQTGLKFQLGSLADEAIKYSTEHLRSKLGLSVTTASKR